MYVHIGMVYETAITKILFDRRHKIKMLRTAASSLRPVLRTVPTQACRAMTVLSKDSAEDFKKQVRNDRICTGSVLRESMDALLTTLHTLFWTELHEPHERTG